MTTVSVIVHPEAGSIAGPESVESLERIVDELRDAVQLNGCRVLTTHVIGLSTPGALRACLEADATLLYTLPDHTCTIVAKGTFQTALNACRATLRRAVLPIRAMGCAGQDLIEYALLSGFIAVAAVAALYPITEGMLNVFSRVLLLLQGDGL